jgi:hypothetical protein
MARGIDVLLLVRDRGVSIDFPPPVEEEARRIKVDWTEELARRHDLRAETIVTIDPSTAKDFDDALSIERIGGGRAHGKSAPRRDGALRFTSRTFRILSAKAEKSTARHSSAEPRFIPWIVWCQCCPNAFRADLCSLARAKTALP